MIVVSYLCKFLVGGFMLLMLQNKTTEASEKDTFKSWASFRNFLIGWVIYLVVLIGSWI